jgi:DNA-binding SARP family transcriptional activator
MSLLWPEASTGNARNLLNAAVHSIRRALGEAVLLTQGVGIVLDTARVRVDVLDFEEALSSGDPVRAIALYSGPFLDGLGLPGAVEFDRWQESQRDRLEELFRTALEQVALAVHRQHGPAAAVQWWRRRVASTPLDARVTMRLMETLAAAGDRGEALRVAATHAQLMDAELGVAPDSGVTELAERLSRETATGSPLARRESISLEERAPLSPGQPPAWSSTRHR